MSQPYAFPRKLLRDEDCADTEAAHLSTSYAWMTREQLASVYDTKYQLVRSLLPRRGGRVLELGVRAGYSAEVFMAAGARLFMGIDANNGTFWSDGSDLTGPAMEALGARYPRRDVVYMLADSHALATLRAVSELAPFDLIHFDGDQTYPGAYDDLTDYMPLLRTGGAAIIDGPPEFTVFDRAARDWAIRNGYVISMAPTPFTLRDGRSYPRDLVLRRATEPEQVIVPGPMLGIADTTYPDLKLKTAA